MPLIHDETRLASAIEAILTLLRGGLPQAALRRVQALLLDWPERSGLWHLLATCQTHGGQPAAVRHSLGRALTLNPALAPAWALLARHEETEGCWEAALAALERAGGASGESFHRLGLRLRDAGRFEAAARAFGRALAVEPDNAGHHFRLGDLLRLLGRHEQARVHLRRARDLAPADPAAAHLLAFLDEAGPPAQLPVAMIQALYDARAADWDGLGGSYRGARLVAEAAAAALAGRQDLAVLDLGCGNGACGLILKPLAARLAGIDLSPGMLAAAARLGCYDRLEQADLLAFLTAEPTESYDLVTAAAVLIHLRDLEPVFGQAARVLAAEGALAFTLFPAEGASVVADGNLYYRHPPALVWAAAARAGLTVELCREAVHEHQHGKPVTALLWLLRRTV